MLTRPLSLNSLRHGSVSMSRANRTIGGLSGYPASKIDPHLIDSRSLELSASRLDEDLGRVDDSVDSLVQIVLNRACSNRAHAFTRPRCTVN